MSEEVFDKEYVSNLRSEAAGWRTKTRELESQVAQLSKLDAEVKAVRVENELIRRGINIDPTWVSVQENQTIGEAIDMFAEKWPHLVATSQETVELEEESEVVEPKLSRKVPPAMPPNPNKANVPGPQAKGSFGDRTMEEIKKDPRAKSQLTAQYRDLIRNSSHQPGE